MNNEFNGSTYGLDMDIAQSIKELFAIKFD